MSILSIFVALSLSLSTKPLAHTHKTVVVDLLFIRRYLELADWDLEEAVRSASEDNEWDRAYDDDDDDDKSTDIRITVKLQGGIPVDFSATGVGLRPQLEQPQ